MRVPTPPEAAFLAITAGVATVSSAIIVPEIVEDTQEQIEILTESSTPENDFNNGTLYGASIVSAGVGAVMYNKAKNS